MLIVEEKPVLNYNTKVVFFRRENAGK